MHAPDAAPAALDGDAYATWREEWLAAEPGARLVRLFVAGARDPALESLLCFGHALADTAFGVRDADVAQAKLGWWLEELSELAAGRARHPITCRLAETGAAAALSDGAGPDAVAGAAAVARLESPATLQELLAVVVRLEAPLARARARAANASTPPTADATVLAAARVASAIAHWDRFALPGRARVPLDVLARVGVDRERAGRDPSTACAVVRSLAASLDAQLASGAGGANALDRALVALGRAQAAQLGRRPQQALGEGMRPGWRSVLALWRESRRR
jgi:phytoene synthase